MLMRPRRRRARGSVMARAGSVIFGCAMMLLSGLGGCMQATLEPATQASFTSRDKKLLADPPYAQAQIPQDYQRHIVQYHRSEAPGSIVRYGCALSLLRIARPKGHPLWRDGG